MGQFGCVLISQLEDHQYPLPVTEDIFTRLNGSTCFAKLDITEAYLQVEVSATSKELLTINIHRGLSQYRRFGVKTAPAIFQQIMDTMLTGVEGAAAHIDEIIVVGRSKEKLSERIDKVQKGFPCIHPVDYNVGN